MRMLAQPPRADSNWAVCDAGNLRGMSREIFSRLSAFIESELGIKMPATKRSMLQSRLQKRLRRLQLSSFEEYCDYALSPEGMAAELPELINVVTTNKTDFFRESLHFEYLIDETLPELMRFRGAGAREPFTVWSAGCSTGEEPYTLAMVLGEFAETQLGFHYNILATDISTRVLEAARQGIYDEERVAPVPPQLKRKYLLRSRNREKRLVRIAPELRQRVRFRRLNFMDDHFELRIHLDVIFCRNVLIYFGRLTQRTVLLRICSHLRPGGYLFVGHSETLHGLDLPLALTAPTVYRKLS